MKIIDLLVKIAKGEEVPKKIKYRNTIYEYCSGYSTYYVENGINNLFSVYNYKILNDEIEIIEEIEKPKKIELLEIEYAWSTNNKEETDKAFRNLSRIVFESKDKINELIETVNYLSKKEE